MVLLLLLLLLLVVEQPSMPVLPPLSLWVCAVHSTTHPLPRTLNLHIVRVRIQQLLPPLFLLLPPPLLLCLPVLLLLLPYHCPPVGP